MNRDWQSYPRNQVKLPKADKLVVEREKIVDYLLNPTHRFGGSKARFFDRFGFEPRHWQRLGEALRIHGQTCEVKRVRETSFGPRFEVEGKLDAPDGRSPRVRSVWQQDHTGSRGSCAPADHRLSSGGIMKFKEHDCAVLTADLPEEGLLAGDVGTIVHVHKGGVAYEVEFITLTGRTVAVVTVEASHLRPVSRQDINHVRELAPA